MYSKHTGIFLLGNGDQDGTTSRATVRRRPGSERAWSKCAGTVGHSSQYLFRADLEPAPDWVLSTSYSSVS